MAIWRNGHFLHSTGRFAKWPFKTGLAAEKRRGNATRQTDTSIETAVIRKTDINLYTLLKTLLTMVQYVRTAYRPSNGDVNRIQRHGKS